MASDGRDTPARAARGRTLAWLLGVNAALAAGLAWVTLMPSATAQAPGTPGQARPRGEYTMVGGALRTGNSNGVYILDTVNQELVVVRWLDGQNQLEGIGFRDLSADATPAPSR